MIAVSRSIRSAHSAWKSPETIQSMTGMWRGVPSKPRKTIQDSAQATKSTAVVRTCAPFSDITRQPKPAMIEAASGPKTMNFSNCLSPSSR